MTFNLFSKSFRQVARLTFVGLLASSLISCGGGGGSAGSVPNQTTTVTAKNINITFSPAQIASTTTTPVTVMATVTDVNGVVMANVPVQFATKVGAIAPTASPDVTDATGVATATLTIPANTPPGNVSVTVSAGGIENSANLVITGTTGTTTIPAMNLLFSAATLASSPLANGVTVTAVLLDQNNNALSGQTVAFSSDSGALVVTQATTDASGHATATLSTNGSQINRIIHVSASGDGVTAKGSITVTGTAFTPGSAPTALTTGVLTQFTFTLQDSAGTNIANAPVTFTSVNGATLAADPSDATAAGGAVTNSSGNVTVDVTATKGGADTLTVSGYGATGTAQFTATNQSLAIALLDQATGTVLNVTPQPIVEYTSTAASLASGCIAINANYAVGGTGAAGTATVSTSRGNLFSNATCTIPAASPATAQFAASGAMTPLYLSSLTAGTATVTVSEASPGVLGPSQSAVVSFNAKLIPGTAPNLVLNASPSVVSPNINAADPTAQFSIITATVRDGTPSNNLVQGVPVAFTVLSDSSQGKILPNVAITQANGQAQANYYPGSSSTNQDGVSIGAVLQSTPTASKTIPLTVGSQALFVVLGTGNTISALDATTYQQPWAVFVTDAAGHPVANAIVTATLTVTTYTKGVLVWDGLDWVLGGGLPTDGATISQFPNLTGAWCPNTDVSDTGVFTSHTPPLIVYPTPYPPNPTLAGMEYPFVMPGIIGNVTSGVLASGAPGVLTDANGYATLQVTYPKDHAVWTNVTLVATAATVGAQSSAQANFELLGLTGDYSSESSLPPGQKSPYGTNACGVAF